MSGIDLFLEKSDQKGEMKKLPERQEIADAHKWQLEDVFASDEQWETEFQEIEKLLPQFDRYIGKLSKSDSVLLECLQFRDQVEERLGKLFLYAGLKSDEDTRVTRYQAYRDQVSRLNVLFDQKTSFIHPEILTIPEDRLKQWLAKNEQLRIYRHYLEDLLRTRPHVLPPEQEKLLAMTGEIAQGPYTIFSMFNNADIKFPSILDEEARKVELTKGRYLRFLESRDRRVRHDAFMAMYSTYGNWTNTLSATLATGIKKDIFYARARKYPNALAAAMDAENIPLQVYDNVVETIHKNMEPLHRFTNLRKEMLGVDAVYPWDLFVPLVAEIKFEMPYSEARQIIQEALYPLGETYLKALQTGFEKRWIDVYENQGKRSGAYSWSTYGVHPYVLLNYNNTLDDVLTVAHEMGHALHSYFTNLHQPYIYSHYTIFVAEVASTVNETLLINYLIQKAQKAEEKLYLLNEYADRIRSAVYIQTLFAEFEKIVHEKLEAGEALTAEALSELNRELYRKYFGPAFEMHPLYDINWCRIPHFYYNFYVYKYVTGFSAATALAERILAGDTEARERYLHFLSCGSADYSINLLKEAGVDMTRPQPIEATTRKLKNLITEMENLWRSLKE